MTHPYNSHHIEPSQLTTNNFVHCLYCSSNICVVMVKPPALHCIFPALVVGQFGFKFRLIELE